MPVVLPDTYVPQQPGRNARDFLSAFGQVSSLMERKQRLQMDQQEADSRQMEFMAKLPAIQAEAKLHATNAYAAINVTKQMAEEEAKAATAWAEPNGYNERFQNILRGISDPKEQADALQALQGEVAWTKQFKAYAPGVDAVNNARAAAYTLAVTNMKLDQHLEETQAAIQGRIDAAQATADAKRANASTYSNSRERIAQINADAKLSVADKQAQRSAIQLESLQQRANEADQMAADAEHDGNSAAAQAHRIAAAQYRDAIQKTTTFAGAAPSAPRDKSQDPKPSPKSDIPHPPMDLSALPNNGVPPGGSTAVAPTKVAKDATVISVGDKQYPIFKDKNGNRAYKIDGHFVPIQTD